MEKQVVSPPPKPAPSLKIADENGMSSLNKLFGTGLPGPDESSASAALCGIPADHSS